MNLPIELTQARAHRYRFGNAEFDESRFELRVGGLVVELERRPLHVLQVLLSRHGEIVSREDLMATAWAGRVTVDNVLPNAVSKLRKALGPTTGARIVNLPRTGYRLDGPVVSERIERSGELLAALHPGSSLPGQPSIQLVEPVGGEDGAPLWLAERDGGDRLCYRLCEDGAQLAVMRREAAAVRRLHAELGEVVRDDLASLVDWNFESIPFYVAFRHPGEPLPAWMAATYEAGSGLDAEARLQLFLRIATAMDAAHAVGVPHGDFHADDVHVLRDEDGVAQPCIGGFGRADASAAEVGEEAVPEPPPSPVLSEPVDELAGNPAELPPAVDAAPTSDLAPERAAGGPVTVQGDVFALGVLLYQMLIGDFARKPLPGWEADVADPLLQADIAAATHGDLDCRLHSVGELLERLRGLPERRRRNAEAAKQRQEAARVAQALERSRVRRPWIIAALAVLVAGVVVSSLLYLRADRARRDAQEALAISKAINRFLNDDLLASADPYASGREPSIRDILHAAAATADQRFADQPAVEAEIRSTLGEVYNRLSDGPAAVAQHTRAHALLEAVRGPDDVQTLEAAYRLSRAYVQDTRYDAAESLIAATDERVQAVHPDDLRLATIGDAARALLAMNTGHYPEAETALRRYLDNWPRIEPDRLTELDSARVDLSQVLLFGGQPEQARDVAQALLHDFADDPERAERLIGRAHYALGDALTYLGQYDAAAPLLEQAFEELSERLGSDHILTVQVLFASANLAFLRGDFETVFDTMDAAWVRLSKRYGDGNPYTASALSNRAIADLALGRAQLALADQEAAYERLSAQFGVDHPYAMLSRFYLAATFAVTGQTGAAQAHLSSLNPDTLQNGDPGPWAERLGALQAIVAYLDTSSQADREALTGSLDALRAVSPNDALLLAWERRPVAGPAPSRVPRAIPAPAAVEPVVRPAPAIQRVLAPTTAPVPEPEVEEGPSGTLKRTPGGRLRYRAKPD